MIPKKITIGGFTFQIELVREVIDDDGEQCEGYVWYNRNVIQILNTLGKRTEQVLWHEILHCIDRIYNADAIPDEATIERLSQGLYQALHSMYPED